nr:UvrB/UvrC motif-containing protein [Natrarchaeobius chitinivorans]
MNADGVRDRIRSLPREPGVYQFREDGTTLYVGKAVDLRSRVRSYADPRSARIGRMVDRADDLEIAVTDTETQALLLEANLIKRHQPRYNVRLKDDKSYPMVQLTDHDAPRIEVTRDPAESATVFGPYTSMGQVETVVKALRESYEVRGCSDHKYANRDRPCLDYEMGLCSAPCTGEIDSESYREDVTAVERFLEGETGILSDPLRRAMETAAEEQNFERAANLRDRLEAVQAFHGEGGEAVQSVGDERAVDVLGAAIEGESATVARLRAEDGKLVDRDRHSLFVPVRPGRLDRRPRRGDPVLVVENDDRVGRVTEQRPVPVGAAIGDGSSRCTLDRASNAVFEQRPTVRFGRNDLDRPGVDEPIDAAGLRLVREFALVGGVDDRKATVEGRENVAVVGDETVGRLECAATEFRKRPDSAVRRDCTVLERRRHGPRPRWRADDERANRGLLGRPGAAVHTSAAFGER